MKVAKVVVVVVVLVVVVVVVVVGPTSAVTASITRSKSTFVVSLVSAL
jgi:hypothetical protein